MLRDADQIESEIEKRIGEGVEPTSTFEDVDPPSFNRAQRDPHSEHANTGSDQVPRFPGRAHPAQQKSNIGELLMNAAGYGANQREDHRDFAYPRGGRGRGQGGGCSATRGWRGRGRGNFNQAFQESVPIKPGTSSYAASVTSEFSAQDRVQTRVSAPLPPQSDQPFVYLTPGQHQVPPPQLQQVPHPPQTGQAPQHPPHHSSVSQQPPPYLNLSGKQQILATPSVSHGQGVSIPHPGLPPFHSIPPPPQTSFPHKVVYQAGSDSSWYYNGQKVVPEQGGPILEYRVPVSNQFNMLQSSMDCS